MTSQYAVTTQGPTPSETRSPALRTAGLLCAAGGIIATVGATVTANWSTSVSPDDLSYPFSPGAFRLTELLWTLTHVLTLCGAIGLARSGLVGRSRLGSVGLWITLAGMALLVPCELAFAFVADVAEDSGTSVALGSAIGLAATLAGVGFLLAGIATVRNRVWAGWGRWTPLLCGGFVIAVLLPVQAVRPSIFLWPIAGWNACLVLFGLALTGSAQDDVSGFDSTVK